jgi:hypothetical protein
MRKRLAVGVLAVSALALTGCTAENDGAMNEHVVVYSITSDASSSTSLTYVIVDGADVSLAQEDDAALPWTKTVTIADGAFSNSILRLAGQLGTQGSTITCDITVDGTSIVSETSTGPAAAVTCQGAN